jgi:hypothetical protein
MMIAALAYGRYNKIRSSVGNGNQINWSEGRKNWSLRSKRLSAPSGVPGALKDISYRQGDGRCKSAMLKLRLPTFLFMP